MFKPRNIRLVWFWGGVLLMVLKLFKKHKALNPSRG